MNRLFFGDNLGWLQNRAEFPDASVDLVYLDPPFNSNADYNVLFKEESGEASRAQFHAFTDTWHWADAAETYTRFIDTCPNVAVVEIMEALFRILKSSPLMAYLAMMAPRLVELRRVLKPTGSLYLHCDPTASHYLKAILDGIFGPGTFGAEIIWKRTNARGTADNWPHLHDVILYYRHGGAPAVFHSLKAKGELAKVPHTLITGSDGQKYQTFELTAPGLTKSGASGQPWRGFDPGGFGRHWANNPEQMDAWDAAGLIHWPKGGGFPRRRDEKPFEAGERTVTVGDVWTDIDRLNQTAKERLGYPTQKPVALLERIIEASSNPGDTVLDPFCGCGTTVHAAQKLGRKWTGVDITYLAINLIKRRLADAFGNRLKFAERGQPTDFESARRLAELDKFQFQQWALSLVNARPLKEGAGKGADRGVDGLLYFYESKTERRSIIVQVKGGKAGRGDVATLVGDVNNQKAAGGVLITLEEATKPMREEAAAAGRYKSALWHAKDFPKIQLLTVESLLADPPARVDAPPQGNPFAKAVGEGDGMAQAQML